MGVRVEGVGDIEGLGRRMNDERGWRIMVHDVDSVLSVACFVRHIYLGRIWKE